jgi:AcrR family transcriptional regulator
MHLIKLSDHMMEKRRRGNDLDSAILDAAWLELSERGYAGLTMEAVAARAGTSRPVLSRRWDGRAALTVAALRHQMHKHPLAVKDRGDLRKELLELLDRAADRATGVAVGLAFFANEYFQHTRSSPLELRAQLLLGEANVLTPILDRAVARGEIDARKLIPEVRTLLTDLFRHHVLMSWTAPPPALRKIWVDAIFLPLVRAR